MKPSKLIFRHCAGGLFSIVLGLGSFSVAHAQIYVSNFDDSTVGEYDPTTGNAINSSLISSGLDGAGNITVSGYDLYVLSAGYTNGGGPPPPGTVSTIGIYTDTGVTVNSSLLSFNYTPGGIAIAGSDLFIANDSLGTINEYNALTGAAINTSLVTGLSNPLGIAVSGSDLYVVNNGTGTIGEYDSTTGDAVNTSLVSGLGSTSIGLAISGSDMFVSNGGTGTIGEYNATTGSTVNASLITGLNGPAGPLKISGSELFVANNGTQGNLSTGTIGEYTTSGATINASLIAGTGIVGGLAVLNSTTPTPVTPTSKPSNVTTGSSYYSSVTPVTSLGGLGTTVSLVGGLNSSGTSQTVTLSTNNLGANFKSLASDVVGVTGNAGSVFAVKLTFDLDAANQNGGADAMTLLWLNPTSDQWENAILGNTGTNTTNPSFLDYQGTFAQFEAQYGVTDANLGNFLGAYGVATSNDSVWAVINHNSNFGVGNLSALPVVVPEPSTWAMLLGGLGLVALCRHCKLNA